MPIPDGSFRLHWDEPAHMYEDFKTLNDALNYAAIIYATDQGTLTRLENCMGEDACPLDQLKAVAESRALEAVRHHDSHKNQASMEHLPIWGTF